MVGLVRMITVAADFTLSPMNIVLKFLVFHCVDNSTVVNRKLSNNIQCTSRPICLEHDIIKGQDNQSQAEYGL
jgi:hypothetical protein